MLSEANSIRLTVYSLSPMLDEKSPAVVQPTIRMPGKAARIS